jgi:hypothetical protein
VMVSVGPGEPELWGKNIITVLDGTMRFCRAGRGGSHPHAPDRA